MNNNFRFNVSVESVEKLKRNIRHQERNRILNKLEEIKIYSKPKRSMKAVILWRDLEELKRLLDSPKDNVHEKELKE